ncbi:MAG TPA: winged helix DNA-binding domain-containing protein [Gaiellaceae bacterium]|nr:winged helix DNA-binding domain-containing protein [Gaiellaceae bacterium]
MRARRLARSALTQRSAALVDVARQTCGIHAQVQASAELQLAARVDGIAQQDVRDALWRERTLVKAWTLRGTLHLHPADELPLWFATRSPRDELPPWPDPAGVLHPAVSAEEVAELRAAVWDAAGGEPLLREQLVDAVVRRVGKTHEARLRSGFAFFIGDLCQGPPQGNKITLVRPDRWLGRWERVKRADALREILRRFLWAYGPARPADFRAWFGSDVPFEDVEEVEVEGRRAFVLAGDTGFAEPERSVRLLPEYDVYVMGFREREQLVAPRVREQVAGHGRGRYEGPAGVSFLLADGVAAGLWSRKKTPKRLELSVAPAKRVSRTALKREAERYSAFLGLELELTVA